MIYAQQQTFERSLLEITDLAVHYHSPAGVIKAVDGVSLSLKKGEVLGLVGESGCGKTSLALSLLKLLPSNGYVADGRISFDGEDLIKMPERELSDKISWKRISIIFQGAMSAMNPVLKVGDQISEVIMKHDKKAHKQDAFERAEHLLESVGITRSRAYNYPHEYSGGMKQRALIAMALACEPDLLIADEPSTALDVIVQAQILNLLKELQHKLNLSMILITHDLSIAAELCSACAIMYAGKIIEYGDVFSIFENPKHPYTRELIKAIPDIKAAKTKLTFIPGEPPNLILPPPGCRFHPRCNYAESFCKASEPQLERVGANQFAACHFIPKIDDAERNSNIVAGQSGLRVHLDEHEEDADILNVSDLSRWYRVRLGVLRTQFAKKQIYLRAVDGISFNIKRGEIFGLVGESGSGKTTVARLIDGLIEPTAGTVLFQGTDIFALNKHAKRMMRRNIQLVFQDPFDSLNPRMTIGDIVAEPLVIHKLLENDKDRESKVKEALEDVELTPGETFIERYPHELSGGQRQRVAIARALVLGPKLILADEPVSMLDVSIRAQVLNIMLKLRETRSIAYLFITHDIALARHLCDTVAVMYLGEIVEMGPMDGIIHEPLHPYTQALISAVPRPDPANHVEVLIKGEPPSQIDLPKGCRFHPRCPHAKDICHEVKPALREIAKAHHASCHFAEDFLRQSS